MSRFYIDNTLFHRLLPLANGEIPALIPGRIPINIARALECFLLSDELIVNPLEPGEIHLYTQAILDWFDADSLGGPCFDIESLDLAGQEQSARLATLEIMALIEDGAAGRSLRALIPSIDTITASWRDAVPENAGRSDWQPLWSLIGEPLPVRLEHAEQWLEVEQSGKLLFSIWCRDSSMWTWLRRHAEWLRQCSPEELDVAHLMFFVLLNQHIARQHRATYTSTDTRVLLGQEAQRSLYRALCSRIESLRREIAGELGMSVGSAPTATAPACPIGLIDLMIAESSSTQKGLPANRVGEVLKEFWATREIRDLRLVISRLSELVVKGAREQAMKEMLRELRDVEEGVRRRLGLSDESRRLEVEHSNWRGILISILRNPRRPLDVIRQESTVRSPRVAMLARAVAR